MDGARRLELERIMAALAGGDRAMVLALHTAFGDEIRSALLFAGREARLPAVDPDEVDGLVLDVCFVLERLAPGWDPAAGAVPWVWARHRLRNLLQAHLGPPTDPLPRCELAARGDLVVPGADAPAALLVLDRLARQRADVALFREALRLVVPDADIPLLLAHAEQVAGGDPAPSVTVASLVGRSPAAVRKAVQRNRRRLADLAERDAGFRPLLRLALLGPARREAA